MPPASVGAAPSPRRLSPVSVLDGRYSRRGAAPTGTGSPALREGLRPAEVPPDFVGAAPSPRRLSPVRVSEGAIRGEAPLLRVPAPPFLVTSPYCANDFSPLKPPRFSLERRLAANAFAGKSFGGGPFAARRRSNEEQSVTYLLLSNHGLHDQLFQ